MHFLGIVLLLGIVCFAFGSILLSQEQKQKIKVYISGPMTGYKNFNFLAFNQMEDEILNKLSNIEIVNPVKISKDLDSYLLNASYEDYLREDFRALIDCDAVLLLEGWKDSGGCQKEVTVANYLNIPCFETYAEFKKFLEENNGCKN